jgi:hypothetical protein
MRTVFFAETEGIAAQFQLAGEKSPHVLRAGHAAALELKGTGGGRVRIVVLPAADSLALWKGEWQGRDRVFLTRAGLVIDGGALRLTASDPSELAVGIFPATVSIAGGQEDGLFTRVTPSAPTAINPVATFELIQPAGPAREIRLGQASEPVAEQPGDADFKAAAVWRIKLPKDLDLSANPLLRIRYVGDVARLTLDGRLLTDDFYNGKEWEVGLREYAPDMLGGDLRLAILPLRKDAVTGATRKIYLADAQIPDFGAASSVGALQGVEIVPRYEVRVDAVRPSAPVQP